MNKSNFGSVLVVTICFFQVVTCFHSDDVDGEIGEGRIIVMSTVNLEGTSYTVSKDSSSCCSACPAHTDLYRFSKGSSHPQDRGLCLCLSAKQGIKPVSTKAGPGQKWFTGVCGCNSGSGGIPCCPDFAPGDGASTKFAEIFIQEDQLMEGSCQKTCQTLYPASTGLTESTTEKYSNGKKKCWCEFDEDLVFEKDSHYQTCMF